MPRGIPGSGPTAAKNNPAMSPSGIDSQDIGVGQGLERVLRSTGDADQALDPAEVEVIDREPTKEHLDELAFQEEFVDVIVAESADRYAERFPVVYVNGRAQYFERGKVQTVRRKFVNGLARARVTVYHQQEFMNEGGFRDIRNIPSTSLAYPFSIVRDTNPKGAEWAKKLLQQAI